MDFLAAQPGGELGADQAAAAGAVQHRRVINAAPIIREAEHEAPRQALGHQQQARGGGLAGGQALLRGLDAVIYRVAHQVQQRVGQQVGEGAVDLHILAHHFEGDLLALRLGRGAQHAGQPHGEAGEGHDAQFQHRLIQLAERDGEPALGAFGRTCRGAQPLQPAGQAGGGGGGQAGLQGGQLLEGVAGLGRGDGLAE